MHSEIFVGREQELTELTVHLNAMLAGRGRVCFVTGSAGSGKSALLRHFIQQALTRDGKLLVALGSCNAQGGIGDPYLPFREALAMLIGDVTPTQAARKIGPENATRLRTALVRSVEVLVEIAPELVGVLVPGAKLLALAGQAVAKKTGWVEKLEKLAKQEKLSAKGIDAAAEQGQIFEQYTAFVQQISKEAPLVLVIDDLQWADSASISLLFHLGRHIDNHRILLLGAYRSTDVALGRNGQRHPLEPVVLEMTRYHGDVTVDLDQIPEEVARRFVDSLLDSEPNRLGPDFRAALFQKTGGHALFTVELIRAMQERGDLIRNAEGAWVEGPSLNWQELPVKVEGVIAERIARLDKQLQELLTVGSVQGEEFTAEVVAQVEKVDEREAVRQLSNELQRQHGLLNARGVVRIGSIRMSLYRFVHSLFQQYLYANLSEAERVYLHRDIGEVLEVLFAGQTEEVAAQLAHHFERAYMPDKAVRYRLQAGNRARRMSAHQEAVAHLSRGLELLPHLSAEPELLRIELGLRTALGLTLIVTHGYASALVEKEFAKARQICVRLQEPALSIPVLYGLCVFHLVRADLKTVHTEGERLLALAQEAGDLGTILACHLILGAAAMYKGMTDEARSHLEWTVAHYVREEHGELVYQQGQDPCVGAQAFLSLVLWAQGYPDQARAAIQSALELAQDLNHAYSIGFAASVAATLSRNLRQFDACMTYAAMSLQVSQRGLFPSWQAVGTIARGWALSHFGHMEEGTAAMADGIAMWVGTGAQVTSPYFRVQLAEAFLQAGQREEGLKVVEDLFRPGEEVWWLPEEHRIYAELLLLEPGHEATAEAHLHRALEHARTQKAKSLELRAAMGLARLWRRQARLQPAYMLLAGCYRWFSEGLDTADLVEARTLLDVLERELAGRLDSVHDAKTDLGAHPAPWVNP